MKVFFRSDSDAVLETRRLLLEPLGVRHAAKLFGFFQNDALRFIDRPESVVELEKKYRRFATHGPVDGKRVWLNWAARCKDTDGYIGWFQASIFDDGSTGLAWVVFPAFWGQGYATEACRMMMAHLVDVYAPKRFFAEMNVANVASIGLAEKLGFARVGNSEGDEFRYEIATSTLR